MGGGTCSPCKYLLLSHNIAMLSHLCVLWATHVWLGARGHLCSHGSHDTPEATTNNSSAHRQAGKRRTQHTSLMSMQCFGHISVKWCKERWNKGVQNYSKLFQINFDRSNKWWATRVTGCDSQRVRAEGETTGWQTVSTASYVFWNRVSACSHMRGP